MQELAQLFQIAVATVILEGPVLNPKDTMQLLSRYCSIYGILQLVTATEQFQPVRLNYRPASQTQNSHFLNDQRKGHAPRTELQSVLVDPIPMNSGSTYRTSFAELKRGGWFEYQSPAPHCLPKHTLFLQPKRDMGWEGEQETLLK